IVLTSACLTAQVEIERAGEWLGLPLAFQTAWQTQTLGVTLWEVYELPAMIWVVTVVEGLRRGLTVGQSQMQAQEKLRTISQAEVEERWLPGIMKTLSPDDWEDFYKGWLKLRDQEGEHPFARPAYWAPFVLVGNPDARVGRTRPALTPR
ncbi:MAG: CHAT domain-containing protein, partial [Chloroflexota bacterium]